MGWGYYLSIKILFYSSNSLILTILPKKEISRQCTSLNHYVLSFYSEHNFMKCFSNKVKFKMYCLLKLNPTWVVVFNTVYIFLGVASVSEHYWGHCILLWQSEDLCIFCMNLFFSPPTISSSDSVTLPLTLF